MTDHAMDVEGVSTTSRITVVVPVYDAFTALQECMDSVLSNLPPPHRLLLIDDASPDRRIWPLLETSAAGSSRIRAVRNPRNLGYTATINRGCELAGEDDVILLNSDTRVTSRWIEKLVGAAASRPRVATVTPVSNAAGAFSVPERNRANPIPPELGLEGMARLVEEVSPCLCPEVPTGNGYCMMVTRAALREVGPFDAKRFPHGCGEETDFCMRAAQREFTHLIDDRTYIYHRRSASLRWRKRFLLLLGDLEMRRLHPGYRRLVHTWLEDDPLDELRRRLKARLETSEGDPAVATSGASRRGEP